MNYNIYINIGMRANEILLELRRYIDIDKYGGWIDAKTKEIHYVAPENHGGWMAEYIKKNPNIPRFGGPENAMNGPMAGAYETGFMNHFVRFVQDNPEDLMFEGTAEDLKAVRHIIMGSAAQPDARWVTIDVLTPPEYNRHRGVTFNMPEERLKLIKFLNGTQ